jgi:hypothetical protein
LDKSLKLGDIAISLPTKLSLDGIDLVKLPEMNKNEYEDLKYIAHNFQNFLDNDS